MTMSKASRVEQINLIHGPTGRLGNKIRENLTDQEIGTGMKNHFS